MTADPVVVLGVLMAFLRRSTRLDRVPLDDLYEPARLVDRLLRCVGLESEPDRLADLMLAAIAATPNARAQSEPPGFRRRGRNPYAHYGFRHDSRRPAGRSR